MSTPHGQASAASVWRGTTAWAQRRSVPTRAFLRTESGSAGFLVAAVVAGLVWANVDNESYRSTWNTLVSIRFGGAGVTLSLRMWINSGLMALFFLVVGLEARREFDLGDLRDRRRFLLPLTAGLVGMVIPVLIFLAVNFHGDGAHGWGVAMSTDTALALGVLALLGRLVPDPVRAFMLTVFVVDDLVALVVIATVYSTRINVGYLVLAVAVFGAVLATRVLGVTSGLVFATLGIGMWVSLLESGVDPIVAGLAIGLSAPAYSPSRGRLEQATGVVRRFREQPTPEFARSAIEHLSATLSPNARLQHLYHSWTSFLIVPLFALANSGIVLKGGFVARAYTEPVTLGVLLAYLVGKPLAVILTSSMLTRLSHGRLRPPVGWAAVIGSGTIAGIGFTVSLLVASLAFRGEELDEAKLGALSAALGASLLTWAVYRVTALLPTPRKLAALVGNPRHLIDLVPPVEMPRDHARGPEHAPVILVEYGDFECPYCGRAEPVIREILEARGVDVQYVWRHLPLTDVHPNAQLAAEAAEAAAAQGAFWRMSDVLFHRLRDFRDADVVSFAQGLELDMDRFNKDLTHHAFSARIAQDMEYADLSGVSGTPTFFINGRRHYGAYDIHTLTAAVESARTRAVQHSKET